MSAWTCHLLAPGNTYKHTTTLKESLGLEKKDEQQPSTEERRESVSRLIEDNVRQCCSSAAVEDRGGMMQMEIMIDSGASSSVVSK